MEQVTHADSKFADIQGYYFRKDVAFWSNFCNDSIKTMVSFSLSLYISLFILLYTTQEIKPCPGLNVCVTKGKKLLDFDGT